MMKKSKKRKNGRFDAVIYTYDITSMALNGKVKSRIENSAVKTPIAKAYKAMNSASHPERKSSSDAYAPFVRSHRVKPYLSDADKGINSYEPYKHAYSTLAEVGPSSVSMDALFTAKQPDESVKMSYFVFAQKAIQKIITRVLSFWKRLT